jgi:hypothetical protein
MQLFALPGVDVSPPTKLNSKASRFKIIGKNQDGYMVRLFGTTDVLQSFGNDLRLIATRTIEFKNQAGLLQHIQLNKSGATVFYLTGNKTHTALIGQPLSGKFIENGKAVLIDSIYDKPEFVSANLRVKQSLNHQFTLFYYPYFLNDKLESILFICIDRALQKVYSRRLILNRPESDMEQAKFVIDNHGNTFAAFLNKKEKPLRGEYETFTIYKLIPDVEDAYETQVKINKNLFGEFYFDADNVNSNILLAGFFDDEISINEPAAYGFFFVTLHADSGTVHSLTYTNFDSGFMNELTGKLNIEPKLYTFTIKRAVLRHDGGALLIAESLIKDTRETIFNSQFSPTFNSIQRINFYQYNDIIAFSIKPDGTLDWRVIMRKKQGSEEDNGIYSSFLMSNERDKIRFIYLDEISTAATLREYILSSDGTVSSNNILYQESKDVMLLPKAGKQVAPYEVVIPSYLRNQLRLVKITY